MGKPARTSSVLISNHQAPRAEREQMCRCRGGCPGSGTPRSRTLLLSPRPNRSIDSRGSERRPRGLLSGAFSISSRSRAVAPAPRPTRRSQGGSAWAFPPAPLLRQPCAAPTPHSRCLPQFTLPSPGQSPPGSPTCRRAAGHRRPREAPWVAGPGRRSSPPRTSPTNALGAAARHPPGRGRVTHELRGDRGADGGV